MTPSRTAPLLSFSGNGVVALRTSSLRRRSARCWRERRLLKARLVCRRRSAPADRQHAFQYGKKLTNTRRGMRSFVNGYAVVRGPAPQQDEQVAFLHEISISP
mmetsp:Transcript_41862/g.101747  ORF Transcript_41862/g.101747 Transcript_41862/m.101747 type:complete len:103 (+) Transcript_41862:1052-1360(+)